jgi:hypothetical protein
MAPGQLPRERVGVRAGTCRRRRRATSVTTRRYRGVHSSPAGRTTLRSDGGSGGGRRSMLRLSGASGWNVRCRKVHRTSSLENGSPLQRGASGAPHPPGCREPRTPVQRRGSSCSPEQVDARRRVARRSAGHLRVSGRLITHVPTSHRSRPGRYRDARVVTPSPG